MNEHHKQQRIDALNRKIDHYKDQIKRFNNAETPRDKASLTLSRRKLKQAQDDLLEATDDFRYNDAYRFIHQLTGCGRDTENLKYIFKIGGLDVTDHKLKAWRLTPDHEEYQDMSFKQWKAFRDGLFAYRDDEANAGNQVFNFPGCSIEKIKK